MFGSRLRDGLTIHGDGKSVCPPEEVAVGGWNNEGGVDVEVDVVVAAAAGATRLRQGAAVCPPEEVAVGGWHNEGGVDVEVDVVVAAAAGATRLRQHHTANAAAATMRLRRHGAATDGNAGVAAAETVGTRLRQKGNAATTEGLPGQCGPDGTTGIPAQEGRHGTPV